MAQPAVSCDEDARRIVFWDDVTSASTHVAVQHLFNLANIAPEPITLIINSAGGEMEPCFGLCDVMAHVRPDIVTVGLGDVCSCGLVMFMAGDRRRLSSSALVLSHQYEWGTHGKHGELAAAREAQDWTMKRLMAHYKRHTGKSGAYIRKNLLCDVDVWLTPIQAKRHGLCDEIIRGNI